MRFRCAPLRVQAVLAPFLLATLWLGSTGCQTTPEPDFEDVPPASELYQNGIDKLNDKWMLWIIPRTDYVGAIEDFQAIIDNYPYSDFAVQAELRIADSYFEDQRYDEALSYYRDFSDLHPQNEKVPYTILRSAQCHYEQSATIDRDQSATRDAMGYLERLLRDYPYAPETREGEQTLLELRGRLARGVLARGDFYMTRNEYQAAAERYRSLLNEYPGLGHDAEALYKLGVCYDNMKLRDEALRLYHVIVENYRESDLAEEAQERISSAN